MEKKMSKKDDVIRDLDTRIKDLEFEKSSTAFRNQGFLVSKEDKEKINAKLTNSNKKSHA